MVEGPETGADVPIFLLDLEIWNECLESGGCHVSSLVTQVKRDRLKASLSG